jgi:hypothetical protein
MAGLSLQTGFRVFPAAPPSAAGTTITQNAYGPSSGADEGGPKTAGFGTVGAGVAAIVILAFVWYSLPR